MTVRCISCGEEYPNHKPDCQQLNPPPVPEPDREEYTKP
jgi:hypothetical protein